MSPEQRLEALTQEVNDLAFHASLVLHQVNRPREFFVDPFASLLLVKRAIEKLASEAK